MMWGLMSALRDWIDLQILGLLSNRSVASLMPDPLNRLGYRQPIFYDMIDWSQWSPCRTALLAEDVDWYPSKLVWYAPSVASKVRRGEHGVWVDARNGSSKVHVTVEWNDVATDKFRRVVWLGASRSVLWNAETFPWNWLDPEEVSVCDRGEIIPWNDVRSRYSDDVAMWLGVSVLRTWMLSTTFTPLVKWREDTAAWIRGREWQKPVAVVHIRLTDKAADRGIAASLMSCSWEGRLRAMVRDAESGWNLTFGSVLVLADDPASVHARWSRVASVFRKPNVEYHVSDMLESLLEAHAELRDVVSPTGHIAAVSKTVSRAVREAYFQTVFREAWVAGALGDRLLGVGSSGVSQYIAHLMADRHQVDANTLALWQEDYVSVCNPE